MLTPGTGPVYMIMNENSYMFYIYDVMDENSIA